MIFQKQSRLYRSGASLQITVPTIWWRNHNLRAGNYVSLTIAEDGKLIIEPEKDEKQNKKTSSLFGRSIFKRA